MASLYEMTQQVKELYDLLQSDEIDSETFADTFEAMSADKIEGYCQIIRQLTADEEMFKADVDRIKAGTFTVSISSSPSVNITDEEKIPNEYRIAQPDKIDKNAIKTALRTEINVPGAEIVYTKE